MPSPSPRTHHQILVIGGGAAGINVAANLRRKRPGLSVAIVEPSQTHYYQPAWTLVGGGAFDLDATARPMAGQIPKGVTWIQDAVTEFQPDDNRVVLKSGQQVDYEQMVVCPGLQLDWHKVQGLQETLGRNGVCSNYSFETTRYTWECIQGFHEGPALFTQPAMPIKCAGAPQKIMYMACDQFRRAGVLDRADVQFFLPGEAMFGVKEFVPPLERVVARYGITVNYKTNLVAVDGEKKIATFQRVGGEGEVETFTRAFGMIHVTPPQSAPDVVKQSPLAAASGWLDLDKFSLQHLRYPNVFGLGDVGSMPNAKTAAAVRMQTPVVVDNLLALRDSRALAGAYDGYGSCPLITERGKVILAEFLYDGKLAPTFPLDPTRERWLGWFLKADFLPWMYWRWPKSWPDFVVVGRNLLARKKGETPMSTRAA